MARVLKISARNIRAIFDLKPDQWPPNAYEWLGLTLFENDCDKIKQAALVRIAKILAVLGRVPQGNVGLAMGLIEKTIERSHLLCDSKRRPQYDAQMYRLMAELLEKEIPPATPNQSSSNEVVAKSEEIKVAVLEKNTTTVQPSKDQTFEFRAGVSSLARRRNRKSHHTQMIIIALACGAGGLLALAFKIAFF